MNFVIWGEAWGEAWESVRHGNLDGEEGMTTELGRNTAWREIFLLVVYNSVSMNLTTQ